MRGPPKTADDELLYAVAGRAVTAVIALVFRLGHPKLGIACARRLERSPHVRAAPQPDLARPARADLYRTSGHVTTLTCRLLSAW